MTTNAGQREGVLGAGRPLVLACALVAGGGLVATAPAAPAYPDSAQQDAGRADSAQADAGQPDADLPDAGGDGQGAQDAGGGSLDGLPGPVAALLSGVAAPDGGRPPLFPEGATLPERPGLVRTTPYGEWVFVYLAPAAGPGPGDGDGDGALVDIPGGDANAADRVRVVTLLPCRRLERLVEALESAPESVVRLTGVFTVFAETNYLLPTAFALVSPPAAADATDPSAADASTGTDTAAPADAAGDSPPLGELVAPELAAVAADLEAGRRRDRSLQSSALGPSLAPPATRRAPGELSAAADGPREGERLLRRRGRLLRERGVWVLRFDDGARPAPAAAGDGGDGGDGDNGDGGGRHDRPLVVLPNAALADMARVVERFGPSASFEVSGSVHRYGPQPYVMISMYAVQELEGLSPRG